jgi:2-oxoglutarate ferredoxin oxidoreductase subunit delta
MVENAVMEGQKRRRGQKNISISINADKCRSCGICTEFCPREVLTKDAFGKPKVTEAERCSSCRLCELLCPDLCISVNVGGQ